MNAKEFKEKLVRMISKWIDVVGIGQTKDLNEELIPGFSDIDLFVLCKNVPGKEERHTLYSTFLEETITCSMNVTNGGVWGYGDIFHVEGIDIMPMYFTVEEMVQYVEDVLIGNHIEKDGQFYPTGRLASIETINILYEEDAVWSSFVAKVKQYPTDLFHKLYTYHRNHILNEEDLGRAYVRKDVLFYHQVLEDALDHLLQALFAANHQYFPSRKRSQEYIEAFTFKPSNCYDRIVDLVKKSASSETIPQSVDILRTMVREIDVLKEA